MALTPICLRLETPDGRAVEEYCIHDGEIEARKLRDVANERDREWHQLTSEQLTDHVNRNTVVAQWLEHRWGWRRLLSACSPERNSYSDSLDNRADRRAA
jgi:hypothetical protein